MMFGHVTLLMLSLRITFVATWAGLGRLNACLRSMTLTMCIMLLRSMADGTGRIIMRICG